MEATPAAIVRLSPIIDTRRADFDRAGAERHLPRPRLAVADDLGAAVFVAFLMARDVVRGFLLKSYGEHPAGSLAGDLIEVRGKFVSIVRAEFDQVGHWVGFSFRESYGARPATTLSPQSADR